METFNDWSEAFDYCREMDKPIVVGISGDGEFKLYPSGKAVRLTRAPVTKIVLLGQDEVQQPQAPPAEAGEGESDA